MKIILTKDVEKLGSLGDEVEVKPGYARNYLLPHGLAVAVNRDNIKKIRHQKELLTNKRADAIQQAKDLAEKLEALELAFPVKAGEKGKLFGSVTQKHIYDAITESGLELDRKALNLPNPIKSLGSHNIPIRLHSEVAAELIIKVVEEKEEKVEEKELGSEEVDENQTTQEETQNQE